MNNKPSFVNLHVHSDGSVLDGFSTVANLVFRAKELGQPGIAITDHGNLFNSYNLYKQAKEAGLQPIIGIEAYVAPSPLLHTDLKPHFFADGGPDDVSSRGAYTHMLLFAKNNEGLKSLFKLSELSFTEGFYRKPRMSIELLREHVKNNIIGTTGCPSGELQVKLRLGLYDEALEYARMMQEIFGKENYYMELMNHNMSIDLERKVEADLLKIAKTLNIPLLATADSHYTVKSEANAHEHLLCISTRSLMSVPTSNAEGEGGKTRFAFDGKGYFLHSAEEMLELFPEDKYPEAVSNTLKVMEQCSSVSINPRDDIRPKIDIPEGLTEGEYLRKETFDGLLKRLPTKVSNQEYIDRLDEELDVIISKNYSGYFLVVSDFVRWAKNNDIPVGPGRGCLTSETRVLTSEGFKGIAEIKVGDKVYNQLGALETVSDTFVYDCNEELIQIKAKGWGSGNIMTSDHKVLLGKNFNSETSVYETTEWIPAKEIQLGDMVVRPASLKDTLSEEQSSLVYDEAFYYAPVTEINFVKSPGKVYDFTMPETHSYVTDSYVVHNSAAGSLLAYCLDITDAEPIRHGLLFSRFLNPERESPPDIDMDFNDEDRELVIEYVKNKYGHDRVAQVVTFGKILAKNAVKDTIRILGEPYALGDELTKAMPEPIFGKGMSLKHMLELGSPRYDEAEDFRKLVKERGAEHVVAMARQLEGRIRSTGVHAAALVVSSEPIVNNIPMMMRTKDSAYITQWDYPTAEKLGLLKFDFLGLRNLGVIKKAIANIKQTKGIDISIQDLINGPMDDPATYKLLQAGNTLGVFQLDSGGMRSLLKLLKPTGFNDISAVLSLYRPGPMGVGAHNDYALRKNGLQEVDYIAPELEGVLKPILESTYGLCVSGDTKIWDASRAIQVPISEIEQEVSDGSFYTWSVNKDGLMEKKKVTRWFYTGDKMVHSVKTRLGNVLKASIDHPILTLDGYRNVGNLSIGDYVATTEESFDIEGESKLSIEEASLLGYLTGDGYLTYYQNSFTNSDSALLDKVSFLASSLFDDLHVSLFPRFRFGEQYTTHMYFSANPQGTGKGFGVKNVYSTSFKLNCWLKEIFEGKKLSSETKFVPPAVFLSSNDAIRAYLAGLWDTDGHVNDKLTYLRTISSEIAYGVKALLSRLGISSQVLISETYQSMKGERTSYGVYVYSSNFWDQIIPLLASEKKKKVIKSLPTRGIESHRVNIQKMKQDVLPHLINNPDTSARLKRALSSGKDLSLWSLSNFLVSSSGFTGNVQSYNGDNSARADNPLVKYYLENFASEENLMNSRLVWSRIVSIEEGEVEPVYDIEVEENHNFIAEGVVVHNCIFQEQVQLIARDLSGYTLGRADDLRRAMGKKDREILEKEWVPFLSGAVERGYSEEAVKTLWEVLVPFADYAFNKCVSGDTVVYLAEDSGYQNAEGVLTVGYLFENWLELKNSNIRIKALKGKQFASDAVLDVMSTGVKPVYEMLLTNGMSIKSTLDHRHLTSTGWVELKDIVVGGLVAISGVIPVVGDMVGYSVVTGVQYVGEEDTYDIEMAGVEHNYVANGIVTHNSHTVAYGLISYITGFLKANFAAEYMSALLSSVADDVDKTASYLEDCRVNGIRVLPPDVSKSMVDYYPLSDSEITFGLRAIRGLGAMVASSIVDARLDEAGNVVPFKDFNDFVYRVPKDVINKRILEGLTYGGAFDGLGLTRRSVIYQLPELMKQYQKAAKAKVSTQTSLFDLDDVISYRVLAMDEYPKMEKLKLERQALGLYISGHPIDGLNISNMSSARIAGVLDGTVKPLEGWATPRDVPVRLAGIVTSMMVKRTKKGDMFAIVKLEDRSGSLECVLFPKVYAKVGEFLKLDGVYQFVGFAKARNEEINFVVDNVRPLDFSESGNLSVRLKLTEAQYDKGGKMLEACLRRHLAPVGEPGDDVVVSLKGVSGDVREVILGVKVRRSPALLQEVQEIFGAISIGRWLRTKPATVDDVAPETN